MPATRQPLSVAIITLNAAAQLEACLRSVRFADEIVVVDSGSSDGTPELAARHGARVVHQDWLGFGPLVPRINFYPVRQGFRDGLPGLIHIAIGCFNSFTKYSKMLERQNSDAALR